MTVFIGSYIAIVITFRSNSCNCHLFICVETEFCTLELKLIISHGNKTIFTIFLKACSSNSFCNFVEFKCFFVLVLLVTVITRCFCIYISVNTECIVICSICQSLCLCCIFRIIAVCKSCSILIFSIVYSCIFRKY